MPKKILYWCAAVVLSIPLLITPFTLYPYIHGKTFASMLVALIGIVVFLYYRYQGEAPKIILSPIIKAALIFLATMVVISILGVNFERSFWGSWPRILGLYHLIIIFWLAFILGTIFKNDDWQKLMRYGLYVSALVSAIAVLQKFFPIFIWHGYRVGSTLDNPSFLAGYLIFFIFWGLLLLFREWRWSVAIPTALSTLALVLTKTRGAIIGLTIGLALAGILLLLNKNNRRYGLRLLMLILVGGILVAIFDWGAIERLTALSLADTTVFSRLVIWKIAWQSFLAHPITGFGFENFNAAFNSFYNPILLKLSYGETFADKAHNLPLELLATTGVAGVIAYLSLFGTAILCLWRMVKRGLMDNCEAALLSGLLVAYLINLTFLFDQLFTVILFAFTLAFIHTRWTSLNTNKINLRPSLFALGILIMMLALWLGVAKSSVASVYNHLATSIFPVDHLRGDAYFKKALQWAGPYRADIVAERANVAHEALLAGRQNLKLTEEIVPEIFNELLITAQQYPYDARFPIFIGYLGNFIGGKYAEMAEPILHLALSKLSPARQQIRNILTENYMVRGLYAEAVSNARETVLLSPTVADPHYYLGNALLLAGEEELAFREFARAEELGYPLIKSKPYEILISQAIEEKKWIRVIELYQRAIAVDPANADLFAQLAAVYSRIGNRLKAIEAVEEAVRLNPMLKDEAERFIKSLR